jgi:hypothetical protein
MRISGAPPTRKASGITGDRAAEVELPGPWPPEG